MTVSSRAEIIDRARTMWPTGTVPYSQSAIGPHGYRQDCSGFVSMCWGIPPSEKGGWGGQSTTTLVSNGYMYPIQPDDLLPGDAIGICGPGSAGNNGHIVLFEKWVNDDDIDDNRYWTYEQSGDHVGPLHRIIEYPYDDAPGPWRAWRYNGIEESKVAEQGGIADFAAANVRVVGTDGNTVGSEICGSHVALTSIWSGVNKLLVRDAQAAPTIDYRRLAEALLDGIAARQA